MTIKIVKVGYLEENCYILTKDNKVIIIDPGDEASKIIKNIDGKLVAILVTHNHFDHIGAINDILKLYDVPVFNNNLEEGQYNIDGFIFDVIFTKGHTSDSVSYKFEDKLFCGDFIFKDSIGRTDMETGSMDDMIKSINKIKKYPNMVIYPGHGDITTLDYEIENNYYFR